MTTGFNSQLLLALAIAAFALALFGWQFFTTIRRVAHLASESTVPRRYMLLGLVAGLCIIYFTRR